MKTNLKKMISYYKPYRGMFILDMLFAIIASSVVLVFPLITRYILYNVLDLPYSASISILIKFAIIMIVLIILEFVANYFMGYCGHMIGTYMEHDMRREIFGHYQKLSFTFYDNQKVGQLLSRVTSDLFDICELLHHGPEDLVISIIKLLGSSIILFIINLKLGLITVAFLPIMFVVALYFNKKMKRAFKKNREKIAEINETIEDSLSGIRVVKSFGNENIEEEKFRKGNANFVNSKKRAYKYWAGYNSLLNLLVSLITMAVIFGGAYFIFNNSMTTTDLITFFLYLGNMTDPVKKLINFTESFQNGYAGFERFREIINIKPDIEDSEDAISINNTEGKIEFQNVTFSYDDKKSNILENINLVVEPGEYIALVGPSGAGKTTLLSLIPRFYDVDSGKILLDGIDIRNIKINDLRSQIGLVQQDVYLFAGSIIDNIRYGRPDATDEDVVRASKLANIHDYIMSLPDGYQTEVGQRGVRLSGGQKQRISIARVFLKNPSILILDEATSALDNESEKVIQDSIDKLCIGRTTFVIAHRLTTIHNAKKIIVLTNEGIVESGTHEELMKRNGIYKQFYQLQYK